MSDNLHGWLDVSGPEFDYLGHFRAHEWLCEGHNDLRMADQIEAGQIPDIHPGSNLPADAEPGNIADTSQGSAAGAAKPSTAMQSAAPAKSGGGNLLGGPLSDAAYGSDYSGGEAGVGGISEASSEGVGSSLAGIFGL